MKLILLNNLLLLIEICSYVNSLKCGENEIEGCIKCSSDYNSNKCELCKDKYTLVLDGANCLKCDDELFGLKGCSGNCELNKSDRLVKCQENSCKEGFYEIYPGYCAICSFLSNHCIKCSYLNDTQTEEKIFKCLECEDYYYISNGECVFSFNGCKKPLDSKTCLECDENYILTDKGKCISFEENCIKAEYDNKNENIKCIECKEQYFLDGYCKFCNQKYENYNSDLKKCVKCSKKYSNKLICEKAMDGYYVTISGNTHICPDYCSKCSYYNEENSEERVLKCDSCIDKYRYISSIDGKCKNCKVLGNGCNICSDDENAPCSYCESGYFLFNNTKCIKCNDTFGEGSNCDFSYYDGSFYSKYCEIGFVLDNFGKCLSCKKKEETGLEGCITCLALGKNFYCYQCENNYILIDGKCILRNEDEFSTCLELENIGTNENILYSCKQCIISNNVYIFAIKENGVKICIIPFEDYGLTKCILSKKEIIGEYNYTCIECEKSKGLILGYDKYKKKQACICQEKYYKKYYYNSYDFECQFNETYNNDSCSINFFGGKCEKCILKENYVRECILFKEPYFLNNESTIDFCYNYLDNCLKCGYNNINQLKCEKCKKDYFPNKNGICQRCYINKKIGPSCFLCADDENIIKTIQCQKCANNYFLTKENTCVFCKSENIGGPNCLECGYINYDGQEIIGCINCDDNYKLSEDGKCYYYEFDFHCDKFGIYIDKDNNKQFGCLECFIDYCLDENNQCVKINIKGCSKSKIINRKETCYLCKEGYNLVKGYCEKIIPDLKEQKIEGCLLYNYKYNYYYCVKCDKNYYKVNGYCFLIPNYPILKECKTYNYYHGKIYCALCIGDNYYDKYSYGDMVICGNNYFGNCSSITNIGDKRNPKYSCGKCKFTNMTDENGILKCIEFEYNKHCLEGKINTNYYNNIYTCTKCEEKYILSYDDYFSTYICKDIFDENNNKNIYNLENYDSDIGIEANNGKCKDGYFTRNSKICIKCDDETNGMPGCNGNCNFIINRKKQLKCELDKCKDYYFEIEPGICHLCNNILLGCKKCSYINNEQTKIIFPIRKRELICNECEEGFFLKNNFCISCNETFSNCDKCTIKNNEFECIQTKPGYYINEDGNIEECPDFCDKCEIIIEDNKKKLKCLEAISGYYIDNEGNIEICEEGCKNCEMIGESLMPRRRMKINVENFSKCNEAITGYFINSEGEIKKCNDENEGNKGCILCEFNSKLKCKSCQEGYELVGDKCISYKELYNLDGCKELYVKNDLYFCNNCIDNYLYISNLKKCVEKNEEIILCKQGNLLDEKYNCTECVNNNSLLIKNWSNYYSCYNENLINKIYDCNKYMNKGTYNNPFFVCDKCNIYYTIITTDDENQICSSQYDNKCKKGKLYFDSQNKEIFECIECKDDYQLIFNNITEKNECQISRIEPIEPIYSEQTEIINTEETNTIEIKCEIENCDICKENNLNVCEKCKSGFIVNKLGKCYIKPKKIPQIIFKDIFRYSLNGQNNINGNKLFYFEFYIRGITSNDITSKHSFIISTIFEKKDKLRYLNNIENIKTNCEYKQELSNKDNTLKYVDYKCVSDYVNQNLSNYKINNINEGQYEDKENLKSNNLTNLISKVNDISKLESIYNENELNKYIIFTVNKNCKKIEIKENDFNITIYGKINKEIKNKIIGNINFYNIENLIANCEINVNNKDNAFLVIKYKISDILSKSESNKLILDTKEIIGDNYNIFFDGLDEVEILVLSEKEEKEKKNTIWLIILLIAIMIIIFVAIIIIYFIYKRKKEKKILDENKTYIELNKQENKNTVISHSIN